MGCGANQAGCGANQAVSTCMAAPKVSTCMAKAEQEAPPRREPVESGGVIFGLFFGIVLTVVSVMFIISMRNGGDGYG